MESGGVPRPGRWREVACLGLANGDSGGVPGPGRWREVACQGLADGERWRARAWQMEIVAACQDPAD